MSFNTIADAVSTCHLVSAIQFSMMDLKLTTNVFEGLTVEGILKNWSKIKPMIVKDWSENIDARFHLFGKVRGSQLWGIDIYTDDFDLVAERRLELLIWSLILLTHRQRSLPSLPWQWNGQQLLGPQHQLVLESARVAGLFRWLTQALLLANEKKIKNDFKRTALEEEQADQIDLSCFSGNLRHNDRDNARDCWKLSDGNNFRIPAGKHLMDLVAVDWFKDTKRMDHVARRQGCAAQVASEKGLFSLIFNLQVPGSTHYSLVFYFVTRQLAMGSLLQQFVDGDNEFRNSRLKLIPSVPEGSWIVRQSVGSTPCLLGKAIDVDIGSSTVASGVLGLVIGVITTLVVDMAFLVQANTTDELPERLIGAVCVSHIELKSAVVPKLEPEIS
ncbi:hypothetical protein CUMW_218570 [Citrus unshiu]|uniref:Protein ENHANCED DISEASE RESISTANCE 2 C-terminal domain-containing protein n=1 Tax=Citrus unshiu TaxID=55188 RepID=A0A2H5QD64_CITUN|nr:hypothetical protein CUMW_218570 [Citrus unshiu]